MTYICSAIGTPLHDDDSLDCDGLRAHLDEQRSAGVDGVLVAGTMGAMPLLTARTYGDLLQECVSAWRTHGEILVGVGDMSFARTKERLQLANELDIDGVVVLPPYFFKYSQADLIDYYLDISGASRAPVYLYDLPQRTGVSLQIDTVVTLAEHPNIAGIKCSGEFSQARRLCDALRGSDFRVIIAQTQLIDVLLRAGFNEHVDGIFAIVPKLVCGIRAAASQNDWRLAAERTRALNNLLTVVVQYGVLPAMTVLLNRRGISGNFAPRPHRPLAPDAQDRLLSEPAVQRALFGEGQENGTLPPRVHHDIGSVDSAPPSGRLRR